MNEIQKKAYDLIQKLSDAEMLAVCDMCSKQKCAFARAGVCDPNGDPEKAPCVFSEIKEFLWEIVKGDGNEENKD